ncbi:nicotinamide riboside transporter PnuC [Ferruginibacter profundus]
MSLYDWCNLFWQQIKETDGWQWCAVITGVAEVLLAKANKVWLYPAGIISTVLTAYILFDGKLYAESLLNVYYVVMSIYGWWYWVKKNDKPVVKISYCNRQDWLIVALITAISFTLLAFVLKYHTTSNVPYWDAWVSATAWAGMWLLSKRKIENWIVLNLSNLFAIPLLLYKQYALFAVLTLFLFVVAILGYYQWRKILQNEKPATTYQ